MASGDLQFRAFISYSHRDKRWAAWLHRALETYRVPRHLVGRETSAGLVGSRIGKIFRDRDELAVSADLSGEINEALKNTQFLVVLCSPASAKSDWVNQEIINFKRLKGDSSIICMIADGEPYASLQPGQEGQECFAPALRYQVKADGTLSDIPAEPVAADLRPHADGKRRAKLKVIAGLLDVGLDELVQRENQRYRRRLAMLSAASIAGVVTLSTLTYNAIVARDLAEARLAQAEGFVEYMIGDLRENLEPIGRLDVLDSVSSTALDYYAAMNPDDMNADSLARRSRAFHMLGEIQDLKGDLEAARTAFSEAKQTTEELLARDPDNTQRIYDHAQSVSLLGYTDWKRGQLALAEINFLEYRRLASSLLESDSENLQWLAEVGFSHNNLGVLYLETGQINLAIKEFVTAEGIARSLSVGAPTDRQLIIDHAQSLSWLSDTLFTLGNFEEAENTRRKELDILIDLVETDPRNIDAQEYLVIANRSLARIELLLGKVSKAHNTLLSAKEMSARMSQFESDNIDWKVLQARTHFDIAELHLLSGDLLAAKKEFSQGKTISVDIIDASINVVLWLTELRARQAILDSRLAISLGQALESQLAAMQEIQTELEVLQKAQPNHQNLVLALGEVLIQKGNILEAQSNKLLSRKAFLGAKRQLANLKSPMPIEGLIQLSILASSLETNDSINEYREQLIEMGVKHPSILGHAQTDATTVDSDRS